MSEKPIVSPAAASADALPQKFWTFTRIYFTAASICYWACIFSGWYASHPMDQHWYNLDAGVHSCVMFGSFFLLGEWREHRKALAQGRGLATAAGNKGEAVSRGEE